MSAPPSNEEPDLAAGKRGLTRGLLDAAPVALALGLFAFTLFRTAWLCDDAYISFRAADNLVHGFGLVWNTTERVQAFTNPLWTLLHAGAFAVTRESYFTPLALSAVVSFLAVLLAALRVASRPVVAVFGLVALSSTRAFVDYSTSGLENPLTHLLLAVFAIAFLPATLGTARLFALALCTGLAAVNRMDTVLLFLPALAHAWLRLRSFKATLAVGAGLSPFLAWEVFSVVYYGFPFPNTAYSKLGNGVPASELLVQGLHYLAAPLTHDPLVPVLLLLGLVAAPLLTRDGKLGALAAGGGLYLLYVVRVGGDFMQGRFLAAPLFVALLILLAVESGAGLGTWATLTVASVGLSLLAPNLPVLTGKDFIRDGGKYRDENKVGDERKYYMEFTGLNHWAPGVPMPDHEWAAMGRKLRASGRWLSLSYGAVGFCGFFAGPRVHILDNYGLADPLIARLPSYWNPNWRIGHFARYVPAWYAAVVEQRMRAIEAGAPVGLPDGPVAHTEPSDAAQTADSDADLVRFYDKLELIVRGPIFGRERWATLIAMNLGRYDHLIDADRYRFPRQPRRPLADFATPLPAGTPDDAARCTPLSSAGLHVDLGALHHDAHLEVSLDQDDVHHLLFMNGSTLEDQLVLAASGDPAAGLAVLQLAVPPAAVRAGYDGIRIMPRSGDKHYSLGHLLLK